MNFKKTFSIFMALVLLAGIVLPCLPVMGTEQAHNHSYGDWVFDTAKGTQSKTCDGCGDVVTLHGTDTKVSQVTEPVIGESYYLAANVNGTIYFFRFGSPSNTTPYALWVTDDLSVTDVRQVVLETPVEGNTGFQMIFADPTQDRNLRIYCYDVKRDGANAGVMDTGYNVDNYINRHTFYTEELNGVTVLRKAGNLNIMALKYDNAKGEYRMLGVPESEITAGTAYPAMLVQLHTHSNTYEKNTTQHWQVCECGATTAPENHNYVMDDALGYGVCVCGADQAPHQCQSADGKWYAEGEKHYQICGICNNPMQKVDHTYGNWSFDTVKGTQTRSCSADCGSTQTLYGTNTKVSQVTEPKIGESYYLAANVAGTIQFFRHGTISDTVPYSLVTTDNINHDWCFKLTLEDPTVTSEKYGSGFQLTYTHPADGTLSRIYCIDMLKDATVAGQTGVMDTGVNNGTAYKNRHNFYIDPVKGDIRSTYKNNHVLVVKQVPQTANGATTNVWRMLFVPDTELANEGVYPVMLANAHVHSGTYEYNLTQHWQICECGATPPEDHKYVMDDALGYGVCVCGANQAPHQCQSTDGKWYAEGDKHYQICGICNNPMQKVDHTYGNWSFDTVKGIQTRSCSADCGSTQTLYGTNTKVSQATNPTVGESYYLAANVAGKVYFFRHGTISDTVPYSLVTTDNINHDWCFKLTLEDPTVTSEKYGSGFQLTYTHPTDGTLSRIYCIDMLKDATVAGQTGIMDTGVNNGTAYKNRHNFYIDPVKGDIRSTYKNNHVLVVKQVPQTANGATTNVWRMLFVPDTELANEGVYPVMLANAHVHSGTYEYDLTQHWQVCDCGTIPPENHNYVLDEASGEKVCQCGSVLRDHTCQSTDGKWYAEGDKHYQICSICNNPMQKLEHTYGQWHFDTETGTQTRSCSADCGSEQMLYGTDTKVSQVEEPKIGESYYLAANVAGTIYFFRHGSITETAPYSLVTTDNINHNWAFKVTLESSEVTSESFEGSFQFAYTNPADGKTIRIYCMDMLKDDTAEGQTGVMDTGVHNSTPPYKNRHSFFVDVVGGVKVLRKYGNNHILAVKYDETVSAWRMLGVPAAELANEGVYPVMLANAHTHSYVYTSSATQHWQVCDCGKTTAPENHSYVKDEATGKKLCQCGVELQDHTCKSADGKWYAAGEKHHQLCQLCGQQFNETEHRYDAWKFDAESFTQSRTCQDCAYVETLCGADTKVSPATEPAVGESYYLAANVAGKVYFFRHGTVTDTTPYSLVVTDNIAHDWLAQVTLEAPVDGNLGFQMIYSDPTQDRNLRIYCYDANAQGDNKGVMDTGVNTASERVKHSFFVDEVNGVKVLRKMGNNNILAVKYMVAADSWRMLGVPESELANEGVYPVMLASIHEHISENTTYQSDLLGHWFTCACGGKSEYAEHTVTKWEYTVVPTRTTPGQKTGLCTTCGAKAVVDIPPMVAEGYYYLTGTLDGVKYYYRDKTGKESVEHTAPFSLMTTEQEQAAMQVNILWDEKLNTYNLSYFTTRQLNIYMGDVNGSLVKKDGKIDLSSSATTTENLINFSWDPVNQVFYQMEGGVQYVVAFRRMTLTDGTKAVRMLAVPLEELGADTVAMQLQLVHQHAYEDTWSFDAVSHWHACSCGTKKDAGEHQIDKWEVEKEATAYASGIKTGICALCGNKVSNAIPMDTTNIKAPVEKQEYYLSAVLNGVRYYYRHAPDGQGVTVTSPYSLYTVTMGKANAIKVKIQDGNYRLYYGVDNYHIYINGDGVGITGSNAKAELVDFQWDEENKLLYQMENGVKMVLVFMPMEHNKTGAIQIRITSMPMERALIDPTVALARLVTQAPPEEPVAENEALKLPQDATALNTITLEPVVEQEIPLRTTPLLDHSGCEKKQADTGSLLIPVVVWVGIVAVAAIALFLLRNTAFGLWLFGKWNIWSGICMLVAAILLLAAMLLPGLMKADKPGLSQFTIVADAHNMDTANDLAVTLYEKYGVSLPVVSGEDYHGDKGIYLDMMGHNSYGGYKYSVYGMECSCGYGIYINGSGVSLDTAIGKWVKSVKDIYAFPFGLKEDVSGYEWNTDDINMTGLGFSLTGSESKELYDGVELRKLSYESFGYGKVDGYAVIVPSDAGVELKVAAGAWDENTTPENPGEKHTVQEYGKMLTEDGYEVLAITNAGFYDLNTTMTYIPWGLQIVDGYVKKEPTEENPNNTDNWFGQTADGRFVISNTAGYYETYETTIAQGVGGGRVLMKDGKPCFPTTGADYRTVVGITEAGDLIIVTVSSANYAFVTQVFMDLDMDVDCILNLDGGGSTTLHSLDENGDLTQMICETPIEREVADAIAIVKKK